MRSAAPDKPASAAPSASLPSTPAVPSAAPEASVTAQQPASTLASTTLAFVAIAGIGTDPKQVESVQLALELARQAREAGASCLDAAVAGVAALEDDPSLNAGTGAALRLDGSAELEAAVMTSDGSLRRGHGAQRRPISVSRRASSARHSTPRARGGRSPALRTLVGQRRLRRAHRSREATLQVADR